MSETATTSLYERLGGRAGLERILDRFYERARHDAVLGPIFGTHIHDWDSHLQTVTNFWSNHTGGPVLYRGGMGKHLRLGLTAEHFERWLGLWEQNAVDETGADNAAELVAVARQVASNLAAMAAQMSALGIDRRTG
jgi:hemoglobin